MPVAPRAGRADGNIRVRSIAVCFCTASFVLAGAAQSLAGTVVRFDTNFGSFDVELYDGVVPTTVNNFLAYVTSGRYDNTLVHRSTQVPSDGFGVIQGGGFDATTESVIPQDAPIPLEYQVPNARGTIGMARTAVPDSAKSQWFINTTDNSTILDQSNGGGYAVFGEMLGDGMSVVDAINGLPIFPVKPQYGRTPLFDYTQQDFNSGVPYLPHTVVVNSVTVVPEPSTFVLVATLVVAAPLLVRRRRKRRLHG